MSEQPSSREELLAAVQARDDFIAIAAHELRNPMAAILISVQALRKANAAGVLTAEESAQRLDAIERRIRHYVTRAASLLDVSRITAGRYQPELSEVDLSALLSRSLADVSAELEVAGCMLHAAIDPGVRGRWDAHGLEQVIANLLSNAMKYGAGKPIDVSLRLEGRGAVLQVSDQGVGMDAQSLERVFGKFERAVSGGRYGGFGIGLWMSRNIVEALRGRIDVASEPGHGSTFTVTLPTESP